MSKWAKREWTVEEFDAWSDSREKFESVAKAADERGGPSLSLVPTVEQEVAWPTDLLAPAPDPASPDAGDAPAPVPFDGVALEASRNRRCGWSAERQRLFLGALGETGSVHLASSAARLSARSAYQLRARSAAFAKAWNAAEQVAVGRLSAIAFDRAINGRVEQIYRDGDLIAEKRVPNDKILMWLLARLDPKRFALPWERRGGTTSTEGHPDPQSEAIDSFSTLLEAIEDQPS